MTNTLILYGSRYGTTKDTSEKIRDLLVTKDIKVSLVNIDDEVPSLSNFDGVLVGTGIKISMWTKKIKKFVKKQKKILDKRDFKFGFFISCGTASEKGKIAEAKEKYIDNKLLKIGVNYDIADAFGPIYDFSETSSMSNMNKKIIKAGLIDEGWEKVDDILYNLRDMDQIKKFSEEFATML